jgi:LuxR family transcriptional regulator, maltose regulon positive regulatory protein
VINALLATKFHSPLSIGRLTPRPRLNARLEESLVEGCRLVLVTAPAGFGKSTLVSAWLRGQGTHYSWLSLDNSDNEPRQFLLYLVGALQKIDPSLGISQINRIQTAETADSEAVYADVMASLVNEIAALPVSFYLALDDCHLLKNPILLKLLSFLIERQPPQIRMILLSREDLPLPVSRLRARRQLVEIRQSDLQFTPQETEDFLREGMGISHLTMKDILALEQRTEGWIAGLQLAALSMKYDPDPARFIRSFTGSDRYILDYLLDEVFTHQPAELQNFLLSTSILDRFCAPLCDVVFEELQGPLDGAGGRSRAFLEQVEHSNLFLIPLDYHREWFRYHHLFSDLLRHALTQSYPNKVPTLHLRASKWLEANGFIEEAVKHAFHTQDWAYAAEMAERNAWNMILHSLVAIVSEWCSAFPENIIRRRPVLCAMHAWVLTASYNLENVPVARARLDQAMAALKYVRQEERANLVPGAPAVNVHTWVIGQVTSVRSFLLMIEPRSRADPQALIDMGKVAYDVLPEEDVPARSAAILDICYAIQALSDAVGADKKYEEAMKMAMSGGNFFGAVVAEYHRAHDMFEQGRLTETVEFCQQKKETYASYFEHPIQEVPAIALLDQAKGTALLERNQLEEAEQLLRAGLEVGQWMPREELPGYLALARLCAAKDDLEGWADTLRRLDMRWPDISYCTQAVRIVQRLRMDPENSEIRKEAAAWAAAHPPEIGPGIVIPGIGPAFNDEADHAVFVAWAQVQILLGKPAEALQVILPMLEVAVKNQLIHRVIELSLLHAQALYIQGQKDAARVPFETAVCYAETQGYLRLIDQGPVLWDLLHEFKNIAPLYISRLLADRLLVAGAIQKKTGAEQPEMPRQVAQTNPALSAMQEPLSSREMEVLVLMAEGLSNAEIAARLYLSPNTMKSHTQNIYGKLDVHGRVQAVNKARELKLI